MTTQPEQFTVQIRTDKAAAALAGLDDYGYKTVTVNPSTLTERQRQTLAALDFRTLTSYEVGGPIAGNEAIEELLDRAADLIDAKRAQTQAEDAACIDSEIKRLLSCPLADGLSVDAKTGLVAIRPEEGALVKLDGDPRRVIQQWLLDYGFWRGQAYDKSPRALAIRQQVLADPDVVAKIEQAERTAALLMESLVQATMLRKARMEEQAAEQDRIADERKARMKVQLAAFVAEHMSLLQQRRFEAGLMSNSEIIEAITDRAFAPAAHFETFECIKRADVIAYTAKELGDDFNRDEGITIGQRPATELTDAEFEQLEGLKAIFEAGTVEAVEHYGYMDSLTNMSDPEFTVNVARAKLTVGDVKVMRDFVLAREE